mmetsp:Transcript_65116/g.169197  ORF Transcript_65116/g.169197 Transcript_65116/m.169197 type:complete len:86 (+) Transcript_65116:1727-1984(+)
MVCTGSASGIVIVVADGSNSGSPAFGSAKTSCIWALGVGASGLLVGRAEAATPRLKTPGQWRSSFHLLNIGVRESQVDRERATGN